MKLSWLILFLLPAFLTAGEGDLRTRHFSAPEKALRSARPFKAPGDPFAPLPPETFESLLPDQAWDELLNSVRLEPGLPWHDFRPVLKLKGIEIAEPGTALWNRSTGELLVHAPRLPLEELARFLDGLAIPEPPYVGPGVAVNFEARCVACVLPSEEARQALLERIPNMKQLLAGTFGPPKPIAAISTRCEPQHRHLVSAAATPGVKEFKIEIQPGLGLDRETVQTSLIMDLTLANGSQFSQSTRLDLAHYAPVLVELGGAGSTEDPAIFLILRAEVVR